MNIITTPSVRQALDLFRHCHATRSIGVIIGANGTGKTVALRSLVERHPRLEAGGGCLYLRCCSNQGPTRGVKDLLEELGCRGAIFRSGATLQILVKAVIRELRKREVVSLFLDEGDQWAAETWSGMLALYDMCLEEHPVTILTTGITPPERWISGAPSGQSRTLRVETVANLTPELTLAVLREWGEPFQALAERVNAKDPDAVKLLRVIHRGTAGNLRRMRFFATLAMMEQPTEITRKVVEVAFSRMTNATP